MWDSKQSFRVLNSHVGVCVDMCCIVSLAGTHHWVSEIAALRAAPRSRLCTVARAPQQPSQVGRHMNQNMWHCGSHVAVRVRATERGPPRPSRLAGALARVPRAPPSKCRRRQRRRRRLTLLMRTCRGAAAGMSQSTKWRRRRDTAMRASWRGTAA